MKFHKISLVYGTMEIYIPSHEPNFILEIETDRKTAIIYSVEEIDKFLDTVFQTVSGLL